MQPPLSRQALQPSSPMLLRSRPRFVIVLLLLIASAKASQGAKIEAPKAPTSQPPGPYSPRRRCRCPRGKCP